MPGPMPAARVERAVGFCLFFEAERAGVEGDRGVLVGAGDPPGADERRRVFMRHREFGFAFKAGVEAGEVQISASKSDREPLSALILRSPKGVSKDGGPRGSRCIASRCSSP